VNIRINRGNGWRKLTASILFYGLLQHCIPECINANMNSTNKSRSDMKTVKTLPGVDIINILKDDSGSILNNAIKPL